MKAQFTLKELAQLREDVRNDIASVLVSNCGDKWHTARELEAMVNGVGSKYHFATSFSFGYSEVEYRTKDYALVFKRRKREGEKQRCAYLADDGTITGYFEMRKQPVYEYQLKSVSRWR